MNIKKYFVISELLNFLMNYLFVFAAILTIDVRITGEASVLMLIYAFLLLAWIYFIRKKMHNFFLYAACHLPMMVLFLFLPVGLIEKIILGTVTLVYILLDIRFWAVKTEDGLAQIGLTLIVVIIVCNFLALYNGLKTLSFVLFVTGVVYFACYYVKTYFSDIVFLSMDRQMEDHALLKDIVKNDSRIIVPVMACVFVIMFLVNFEFMDRVTYKVMDFFNFILGRIIILILKFLEFLGNLLSSMDPDSAVASSAGSMIEEGTPSPIVTIITNIITVAVIGFIIYLAVKTIIKFIKSLAMNKNESMETIEFNDMVEIRENIIGTRKKTNSNLHRVRKQYKKTVEKNIKKGYNPQKCHTPDERAVDIENSMKNDIYEITNQYNEYRYRNDV